MSEIGAADRFWLELTSLYEAAGKPTLRRLVHLGLEQRPQLCVSHSTINGWLNRKAVPTGRKNERYLTVMVAFLQAKAQSGGTLRRLPAGEWGRLLRAAQVERAAGKKNGRPRRSEMLLPDADTRGRSEPATTVREFGLDTLAEPGVQIIGRDHELAVLAELVEAAAADHGGAVFIEGEPGIGKTALARAAVADAATFGCQVFWGTGDELSQGLPFQPLLDALRVRDSCGDPRRETIARILRGETAVDRGTDVSALLAEQLFALIGEHCAQRPVILVVDDLQWLDQPSLSFLGHLARSGPRALLLVGLMRPVPQSDELSALRRAISDPVRFELPGLDSGATAKLMTALTGGTPDGRLLSLADGAAGNPLYITELVGALTMTSGLTVTSDGVATVTADSVPSSLAAAITERLGFVSSPTRKVLRTAALLGIDFAVTDLAILLRRRVADLADVLHEACAAGVLTESGRSLRFRHPLIHAALYESMPMPVRAAWHSEAGRALAEADVPALRVARQLLQAVSVLEATSDPSPNEPVGEWMVNWLSDAAAPLLSQAPQAAARLFAQAIAGLPESSARHGWLASRLADALYRIGDRSAAEQVANQALVRAAEPDLVVDLHWTLAQCRMLEGRTAESLTALDEALAVPGLSDRHRARLLTLAARTRLIAGEIHESGQIATRALATASKADDSWALGWALHVLTTVADEEGHPADALPLFDRALAITCADPELADLRLLLQINKAGTLRSLDQFDQAFSIARQAKYVAAQAGTTLRLSQAHGILAQILFETGLWDDTLAEMSMVPEYVKEPAGVCCELAIAAVICFHRGDIAVARRQLGAAVQEFGKVGQRFILPLVLARSLEREQAGALPEALGALTTWLAEGTGQPSDSEALLVDTVRLAMRIGDLNTARTVARHAETLATGSDIPHRQANALYCRGSLDHDPSALSAAADRFEQASRPLPQAKALEAAASEYARAGAHAEARAAADKAKGIYTTLGADADVARMASTYETANA